MKKKLELWSEGGRFVWICSFELHVYITNTRVLVVCMKRLCHVLSPKLASLTHVVSFSEVASSVPVLT